MRTWIMILFGLALLLPVLAPRNRRLGHRDAPVMSAQRAAFDMAVELLHACVGREFHRPRLPALCFAFLASTVACWLSGLDIAISVAIGCGVLGFLHWRPVQVRKRRDAELAASWPGFLERTRAKMLASSRSLSYVIFEESSSETPFFNELLSLGRREFENSGDLEKALQTLWSFGEDEETTNYVCAALCDALGSSSSQIERQLSIISSTVRSRNDMKRETSARLAGVRTARVFIIIIPLGMALAGVSFAGSLKPFTTTLSICEMLAAFAILMVCWHWSSRLMTFPNWPTRSPSKPLAESETLA